MIKLDELLAVGCTVDAVRHLIRTGRLWRVHRGVLALEGPLTPEGRAMAATLRTDGAGSHLTAASLTGAVDLRPTQPHVSVVKPSGGRSPKGIVVHRVAALETTTFKGIPITTPARTIIDCAPLLSDRNLKEMLRRSEFNGLDLTTLDRPRIPANLRKLLDHYVIGSGLTANQLEATFYEICAQAQLPRPDIQTSMPERRRVDFIWPAHGLIVETDGRRAHDSFIAFTDDRARDRRHLIEGFQTMRFTWSDVETRTPVERDLVAYFSRR